MQNFMFSSESVTEGHPDKLCDQMSDAVLDAFLRHDPRAEVRAECAIFKEVVFMAARYASETVVDFAHIARQVLADAGYVGEPYDPAAVSVLTTLETLPPSARHALDEAAMDDAELDAVPSREQVTLFGYACTQTPEAMPLPIWLARRLARRLSALRRNLPWLMPDAKVQVGVEYVGRKPRRIHSVTLNVSQGREGAPGLDDMRAQLATDAVAPVFDGLPWAPDKKTRVFVNPDGPVVVGGPSLHSGLTGRKNAVDTYGEYCRQSESALSGKDPLRIDRVGAYAARFAARNLVHAGLASECEVTLSYAIGIARPISVAVETFGTGARPDDDLAKLLRERCEFRPAGIVRRFGMRALAASNPDGFYRNLAAWGHVGRSDIDLPWERIDEGLFG